MSRQYRSFKLLFNLYKRLMTTCNQLAHSHVSVLLKPLRQTGENESAHFIEWRKGKRFECITGHCRKNHVLDYASPQLQWKMRVSLLAWLKLKMSSKSVVISL